jgi:hypothetical protein
MKSDGKKDEERRANKERNEESKTKRSGRTKIILKVFKCIL